MYRKVQALIILLGLLVGLAGCTLAPLALDATATAIMTGMGAGLVVPRLLDALAPRPVAPDRAPVAPRSGP